SASISGSIGGSASSASWSTSGDGTFGNANNLSTSYAPGSNDIANGSVVLTLTTNNPLGPCGAVSDQITVTIHPAATVNAGNDQTVCILSNVSLSGSFGGGATSVTWSTSGDGNFANANSASTTYNPGPIDQLNGSV